MPPPHPRPPARGQWPGLFIAFEGGDGSGKSVQARALYQRLRRLGLKTRLVAEPGGTALGELLRTLVTSQGPLRFVPGGPLPGAVWPLADSLLLPPVPEAELFLFAASRAQLVAEVIRPSLSRGEIVICDRYAPSTLAYQGYGRGLSKALVRRVNRLATQGVWPDVIFLLDAPVALSASRRRRRAAAPDRIEGEGAAFHRRVRRGYLAMASQDPQGWLVLAGQRPRAEIAEEVWGRVAQLLRERSPHLAAILRGESRRRGVRGPASNRPGARSPAPKLAL